MRGEKQGGKDDPASARGSSGKDKIPEMSFYLLCLNGLGQGCQTFHPMGPAPGTGSWTGFGASVQGQSGWVLHARRALCQPPVLHELCAAGPALHTTCSVHWPGACCACNPWGWQHLGPSAAHAMSGPAHTSCAAHRARTWGWSSGLYI